MKKITAVLFLLCSFSLWSQSGSSGGSGTGTGSGPGIRITISSLVNSDTIEILPNLVDSNVVGYKIYDSDFVLVKQATIQPTNNETITVNNMESDHYYIQIMLENQVHVIQIVNKQFIKE